MLSFSICYFSIPIFFFFFLNDPPPPELPPLPHPALLPSGAPPPPAAGSGPRPASRPPQKPAGAFPRPGASPPPPLEEWQQFGSYWGRSARTPQGVDSQTPECTSREARGEIDGSGGLSLNRRRGQVRWRGPGAPACPVPADESMSPTGFPSSRNAPRRFSLPVPPQRGVPQEPPVPRVLPGVRKSSSLRWSGAPM